jgi:N-ethylmaleimide reductase
MDARAHDKLFVPVQVGAITLKHRVVMPPLSRLRAEWPSGVPSDLNVEYYSQRASDGGLIFTEATAISPSARGYRGAPGIYSDEQVTGRRRVTEAVHAKGGYMFVQLWHAGRTTHIAVTGEEPVTASVDPTYWQIRAFSLSLQTAFRSRRRTGRWKWPRLPASSSNTAPLLLTRRRPASTAWSSWPPTAT